MSMLENPGIVGAIVFAISAVILALVARKIKKQKQVRKDIEERD